MLSLTGEYAIRAMVFLAQRQEEWPIPGPRIAEQAGIPRKYLSAILADLVRAGLLEGTRGRSGGFRLCRPATGISLAEVVAPFEPIHAARQTCPFGDSICSDKDPCATHERWKGVKAAMNGFLGETTLQEVAVRRSADVKRSDTEGAEKERRRTR